MGAPRDDGWYESESPTRRVLVAELQRLKRRAQARWPLILVLVIGLTAAVLYKRAQKVKVHRAQVILAVAEGTLGDGRHPMPVMELRAYVNDVLLSNGVLLDLVEELDLFPLRAKLGDDFAINELRDMFNVGVFRNYFLYQYSVDEPRSARIAIVVTHTDPDFAWRMAHRLATLVVDGEHAHRLEVAEQLGLEVEAAIRTARARLIEVETALNERSLALSTAQQDGDVGRTAALTVETAELAARLRGEREAILGLITQGSGDSMALAIDRAGLGMSFEIAEERRPFEEPGARLYFQIMIGAVVFFGLLPVVAIFVGAFDSRVHDAEDVERVGLPVIGHVPAFPGDRVGSLRARGVRGRRVPS